MKKMLIVLALCASAFGQNQISGSITAAGSTCATTNACVSLTLVNSAGSSLVTLAGTWSGTINFEISADGTNWAAVNATPPNSTSAVTSSTSNGTWRINVAGAVAVRVRCSSYSSGTVTVKMSYGSGSASAGGGGGASTFDQLGSGTNTTAAMVVGSGASLAATGSGTIAATSVTTNAGVPATPLSTGTSISLTAPRQYYVCTSTCTVTPPVPSAGYEFCVMNGDNVSTVITLAALGSSALYENTARTAYGTAGTGTLVSGGAVGDSVCILGLDSTHYLTTSFRNTWTAN